MRATSNRQVIAIVVSIVVLASVGVVYCFAVYLPSYEAAQSRLRTLTIVGSFIDLDPALAYDSDSQLIIMNIFDRLVAYKSGTTEIAPSLASSWSTPDATTYIFNLTEGVYFHDGTPFNATCVKYSFERVMALGGAASYLFMIVNTIEVLDPYAVQITLYSDFAPFLSILAHPVASIVSPSAAEQYGDDFTTNPIGTGPFQLDHYELGKNVTLTANTDYFKGPPLLEQVILKTILEAAGRKEALERGEIDMIGGGGVSLSDLDSLEENPDITTVEGTGLGIEYLGFNTLKPPLNDSRVREAIAYAIDYDSILEDAMGGRAELISGPIAPSIFGYKELALKSRDLTKAQQLLDAAGYGDGFTITLTYNIESLERRTVAEIIRDNLADVDITVTIKGLDWESAIDEYLAMEHELCLNNWWPDYPDPDAYLAPQFHSWSAAPYGANIFGLSDPEIDALIDEGLITTDPTERAAIYQEAQEKIVEQLPCLFLYIPSGVNLMRYNVRNWVYSPSGFIELYEIYKQ